MVMDNLCDDKLTGARAIAEFLGEETRRTFCLLERGELPAFKLGGRWCARRSTLLAHIERLEAGCE